MPVKESSIRSKFVDRTYLNEESNVAFDLNPKTWAIWQFDKNKSLKVENENLKVEKNKAIEGRDFTYEGRRYMKVMKNQKQLV